VNRRSFLKTLTGAGLSALSLSFARLAQAEGAAPPRRAIFVYFPDGARPEAWHAQGTGSDFTLPAMTAPLQTVRQHCLFLNGIDMFGPGSTHEGGTRKLLTGAGGGSGQREVSLDYHLGQTFKAQTIKPHLNLNVVPVWQSDDLTYDYNGVAMVPEPNPLAAFDSLFGANSNDGGANQRRISALDASLGELNTLRSRLGSAEQQKLDQHLASLAEVKNKLAASAGGSCPAWGFNPTGFEVTRTAFWDNPEYRDTTRMELIGDLHTDVAVHALACDLTRVVTLKWNHAVNEAVITGSGSQKTCHQASHESGQDFIDIKAWYSRQLAKLIQQLAAIPQSDGRSLLDHTLIFAGSELGHGSWHDHQNMPFILAGGSAGGMVTGRSLAYDGVPHNKLLVSIAQFMGLSINQFGNQDGTPGPLPGLLG